MIAAAFMTIEERAGFVEFYRQNTELASTKTLQNIIKNAAIIDEQVKAQQPKISEMSFVELIQNLIEYHEILDASKKNFLQGNQGALFECAIASQAIRSLSSAIEIKLAAREQIAGDVSALKESIEDNKAVLGVNFHLLSEVIDKCSTYDVVKKLPDGGFKLSLDV